MRLILAIPVILLLLIAVPSRACVDTTVRDAAYAEPRDVYRLTVMAEADDATADATCRRLQEWLTANGDGLNIEVARVDVNDPEVRWIEYGIPSAPPTHPVVVLGRYRVAEMQSLYVDHWEPAPTDDELAQLLSSPAREALQRELGRRLAVLVYIPGTDRTAGRGRTAIAAAVEEWSGRSPLGLAVVEVDRTDDRERLLTSFTGVRRSTSEWVAVVFGRGKFMPPMEGDDITLDGLNQHVAILAEDCTCVRSVSSLGADIPLVWTKAMDEAVVPMKSPNDASTTQPAVIVTSADHASEPAGRSVLSAAAYTFSGLILAALLAGVIVVVRPMWKSRP